MVSLEITDLYKGAFLLCMGARLDRGTFGDVPHICSFYINIR